MRRFITSPELRPGLKPWVYKLLSVLFWLLVWQLLSLAVGHEFLLASPARVLASLLHLLLLPATYLAALSSTLRILAGFLSAAFLGILLAVLAHRYRLVKELLLPLIAMARAVPVASFVILAIILVSTQWLSALISFVIALPVVYGNTLEGIRQGDRSLQEMALLFRVPLLRRVRGLYLPQLLPYLRSSLVTALGLSWKSGIAAEVIGIPRGSIGEKLYSVKVNYYTADLFAWTILIVLLSLACIRLLTYALSGLGRQLKQL